MRRISIEISEEEWHQISRAALEAKCLKAEMLEHPDLVEATKLLPITPEAIVREALKAYLKKLPEEWKDPVLTALMDIDGEPN